MTGSAPGYDFIIVGAGAAGCVLANRLSADAGVRVLLLEAGGWNRNPLVQIPLGIGALRGRPRYDWRHATGAEPYLAERSLALPQGRGVGGSAAINGMVYVRGHPQDFDHWRQLGNQGWAWRQVLPYFQRAEAPEYLAVGAASQPRDRCFAGPLCRAFVEAGAAAGYALADRFNGAPPDGFGYFDFNIRAGRRWSAYAAYLGPALRHSNLTVSVNARITRIVVEHGRAVAVEWRQHGVAKQAWAAAEVIVSAGAIGSPWLLQLSGIGDADCLHRLGIPVAHALRGVGRNLQNHPDIAIRHVCLAPVTLHSLLRADRLVPALLCAWLLGSGPASAFPGASGAFIRSRPALDRPDLECHLVAALRIASPWFPKPFAPRERDGFSVRIMLLRPQSRGSVKLACADPRAPPVVCHRYLERPADLDTLASGVRLMRGILAQAPLDRWRGTELEPGPGVQNDADLQTWIRCHADTQAHPVGTCRMGHDDEAVVDSELRVHGLAGLRVVDASVMPAIPSANTFATTVMIAEKAADLILGRTVE